MKKLSLLKYVLSTVLIVVLVAGALYFPKLYNYKQDNMNFNKVHTYEQDEISLYERDDTSIPDRIKELIEIVNIINNGAVLYQVVQFEGEVDEEYLLEKVVMEINRASECGLIPDISSYYDLKYSCNIQCMGIESYDMYLDDFKFWRIELTDSKGGYYNFIVDYDTYMIYHAEIYCEELRELHNYFEDSHNNLDTLSEACMQYYMPDEIGSYGVTDGNIILEMMYGEEYVCFENRIIYDDSTKELAGISVGIFI